MLNDQVVGLLDAKTLASGDEYSGAIAELKRERKGLTAEIAQLERDRPGRLLQESDEELGHFDQHLAAQRRQVERIDLAIPQLEELQQRAAAAEASDTISRRIAEGVRLQKKGIALVQEYGKLAGRMVVVLADLEGIDGQIEEIRREAETAGRLADAPKTADATARPGAPRPLYALEHAVDRLYGHQGGVQLPSATGHGPMIRGTGPDIPRPETNEERDARQARERAAREEARQARPAALGGTLGYDDDGNLVSIDGRRPTADERARAPRGPKRRRQVEAVAAVQVGEFRVEGA